VISHLTMLVVFSGLVSLVFALLMRDEDAARWRFGLKLFGAFVIGAFVAGWIMFPFPT
jgi:hypothetical protein